MEQLEVVGSLIIGTYPNGQKVIYCQIGRGIDQLLAVFKDEENNVPSEMKKFLEDIFKENQERPFQNINQLDDFAWGYHDKYMADWWANYFEDIWDEFADDLGNPDFQTQVKYMELALRQFDFIV